MTDMIEAQELSVQKSAEQLDFFNPSVMMIVEDIMNKTLRQTFFWLPRLMGIIFVLFLSLFALDIFDMKLGFWGIILGLFMHLIPSIILAIAIAAAWRREWIGEVVFMEWCLFLGELDLA